MAYQAFDLTGKVAVVIGGTSGIGRAIAHGLAEAGADVVPTSRRIEQVKETASEIRERGRRSLEVVSDVSDRTSLSRLLTKCIEEFGKVDAFPASDDGSRHAVPQHVHRGASHVEKAPRMAVRHAVRGEAAQCSEDHDDSVELSDEVANWASA